jgi:hypothetical protein
LNLDKGLIYAGFILFVLGATLKVYIIAILGILTLLFAVIKDKGLNKSKIKPIGDTSQEDKVTPPKDEKVAVMKRNEATDKKDG